jgi:hypothetical protein
VGRKVVTDTGCFDWWSHSCIRCISWHEYMRFVECDPQFNLENSMIIHLFWNMTPCLLVAYYRWIGNHLTMVMASHYRILELLSIPLMQDEISTVILYTLCGICNKLCYNWYRSHICAFDFRNPFMFL